MAGRLSSRMAALAHFVTCGSRLADVGTDHGYIPIFLCRTGRIPSAIAMDINRGPLQRAEAHVAEYGLQEKIELRLSDGLHALAPGEADTILIAGMGGALVKRILSEGAKALTSNPELILQPQSEIASVRAFLREIGYMIVDEDCVLEDGKFYFLMKARRVGKGVGEPVCETVLINEVVPEKKNREISSGQTRMEDVFGPILLKKKHSTLRLFLERELSTTHVICEKLARQMEDVGESSDVRKENLEKRLTEMKGRRQLIEKALQIYQ